MVWPREGSVVVLHLAIAWGAILVGLLAGTVIGLFFHREDWLGGYNSWRRRMVRLGHVAFLGTGMLNLAFAVSIGEMGLRSALGLPSALLILGTVSMPAVCFLAAWRKPLRHLFFIPVLSLIGGAAGTLLQVVLATGGH
jgi:hypothetical protein